MAKFINENRIEASPYLFEYLCYKMAKNKLEKIKQINEEISIISEKYLSSEISNKSESIKKKYVFAKAKVVIQMNAHLLGATTIKFRVYSSIL